MGKKKKQKQNKTSTVSENQTQTVETEPTLSSVAESPLKEEKSEHVELKAQDSLKDIAKKIEALSDVLQQKRMATDDGTIELLRKDLSEVQQNIKHSEKQRDALNEQIESVQSRQADVQEDLASVKQNTDLSRLSLLISERVNQTFQQVVNDIEDRSSGLTLLKSCYQDILDDLKGYIECFEPGGLEFLKQKYDTLDAEYKKLEHAHKVTQEKLTKLETQALVSRVTGDLSPEEIQRKLQELYDKQAEIENYVILQSRVDRLSLENEQLKGEIEKWQKMKLDYEGHIENQQRDIALKSLNEDLKTKLVESEENRGRLDKKNKGLRRKNSELSENLDKFEKIREDWTEYEARQERLEKLLKEHIETNRSLESQKDRLNTELQTLQQYKITDEERRAEIRRELDEAYHTKQIELRQKLRDQLEAQLRSEHHEQFNQIEENTRSNKQLSTKLEDLNRNIVQYQLELNRKDNEIQEQHIHIEGLEKIKVELTEQRDRQQNEWQAFYEQQFTQYKAAVDAEVKAEREKIAEQRQKFESECEQQIEDFQELERTIHELEGQKGQVEALIEHLKIEKDLLIDRTPKRDAALSSLKLDLGLSAKFKKKKAFEGTEQIWLDNIEAQIGQSGFKFDRRLLYAFHTALKISDYSALVVLAGISGTGKSELPRLYADFGGIPFYEVAVQPSWDSPQDLFGFFNYTDGRYKAEPLSRLLYELNQPNSVLAQSPIIWLLDEMNLARVEYYFADLLSKLETRRGESLKEAADSRASIALDIGPHEPINLALCSQMLFVGTMNEDESTLGLSDKVLDRSSLIRFPRPKKLEWTTQIDRSESDTKLSWDTWRSWLNSSPGEDEYSERLNRINHAMDLLGRPFGHRLFRSIHAYISNYPDSSKKVDAYEDQFEMKIVPRLRGLETSQPKIDTGLKKLEEFVPDNLKSYFKESCEHEFFQWTKSTHPVEG